MPRASRYLRSGYTFHLTHRCHDRRYLLKFAKDRDAYREWLRVAVKRHNVAVYSFCITENHVHLVVHVDDRREVAAMMHLVAGSFATQLNKRKGHEGSVWEHSYHCTVIQNGQHLLNCLKYVSLNMVRAGVVGHPSEWRWCSHDELIGQRSRYRIINIERLLRSLEIDRFEDFKRVYEEGVKDMIERGKLARESEWSESLAIGDRLFVEGVAKSSFNRSSFEYNEACDAYPNKAWSVKEPEVSYS